MKRVILLREPSKQSESRLRLSPLRVIGVPAFEMRRRQIVIPKKVFDFVLITSAQTLRFLPKLPKSKLYLFIGESSFESSGLSRRQVCVLKDSNRHGVLQFFRKQKPASIYFPRSAEADVGLVHELRRMGHRVMVSHPYGLYFRNIRKPVLNAIKGGVDAVLLTSPSCFRSLRKAFSLKDLRSWAVAWLVIGPTTRAALRGTGLKVQMATKPSLAGLRQLALKL